MGLRDHLPASIQAYPPQFLRAGIVEPEETAVAIPYKHTNGGQNNGNTWRFGNIMCSLH
jgi:hypothetical protein